MFVVIVYFRFVAGVLFLVLHFSEVLSRRINLNKTMGLDGFFVRLGRLISKVIIRIG